MDDSLPSFSRESVCYDLITLDRLQVLYPVVCTCRERAKHGSPGVNPDPPPGTSLAFSAQLTPDITSLRSAPPLLLLDLHAPTPAPRSTPICIYGAGYTQSALRIPIFPSSTAALFPTPRAPALSPPEDTVYVHRIQSGTVVHISLASYLG